MIMFSPTINACCLSFLEIMASMSFMMVYSNFRRLGIVKASRLVDPECTEEEDAPDWLAEGTEAKRLAEREDQVKEKSITLCSHGNGG